MSSEICLPHLHAMDGKHLILEDVSPLERLVLALVQVDGLDVDAEVDSFDVNLEGSGVHELLSTDATPVVVLSQVVGSEV